MSILATVTGTIALSDPNTGSLNLSKLLAQTFTGSISAQGESVQFGITPTTITLPISPAPLVYVANLSTANTVTVTWTPNAGASAIVQVLQPAASSSVNGGMLLLANSNTTSGITALSITASGANTAVDYLILG